MHAHEILKFLHQRAVRPLGETDPNCIGIAHLMNARYDRGSVEDQLWEEFAYMRSTQDPDFFVTIRDLQEGWYGLETLNFKGACITFEKYKVKEEDDTHPWKWTPEELATVLQKRKDLGL